MFLLVLLYSVNELGVKRIWRKTASYASLVEEQAFDEATGVTRGTMRHTLPRDVSAPASNVGAVARA